MREKTKTSIHLLLASIVTIVGVMLIFIILALSWEPWMVPVIMIGNTLVWILHITRAGSETFYENLCAGLLMVGFFFFGVHNMVLYDVPAIACMLLLVFSILDKRWLLYLIVALYVMILLYQGLVLHTIHYHMGTNDIIRLVFGATVIIGATAIAKSRITRRLESQKAYDLILEQMEKTSRQNAEFLSNVSHELRTPINMVLGISEVILEKNISPEIRIDMQSIKLAGKRLSTQINNMLDYTEVVEGTLVPAKEPYGITSVFNDIITMTAIQSGKHHLEMIFDMEPKMPAVLIGDAEKISHVLKILLDNSIKFTEEGGLYVHMETRQENYGINLVIDICDTGIGMTNSQITEMFDNFYQADSGSSRFAGGLGLGLPIARGLLEAMGGFIHFDNSGQRGLNVRITIPQGVEDSTPAIALSDPKRICIACYFRPEKFTRDEVREYYDKMFYHTITGLGIEGYQAHNFGGLQKLLSNHSLTHVFIAQGEFEKKRTFYEDLARKTKVIIIADQDFALTRSSRLLVIRKPFSAISIANLLNGNAGENEFGEAQAAGRKPFSCEGVRVLAVDDEEMNLVVAKGVLGSYGIQVDTCLSGKEAVELCASSSYDIVFLDHMMPGFDGVETLKQIRQIKNGMYQDLPVIALTANTISGAREMFRNEGFTEFIPKPIERAVLERVLRKVLSKHQVLYDEMPMLPEEATEHSAAMEPIENQTPNDISGDDFKEPASEEDSKEPPSKKNTAKKVKPKKEKPRKKEEEEGRRKRNSSDNKNTEETISGESTRKKTNQKAADFGTGSPAESATNETDSEDSISCETDGEDTNSRNVSPTGTGWDETDSEDSASHETDGEDTNSRNVSSAETGWDETDSAPDEVDSRNFSTKETGWSEEDSEDSTPEETGFPDHQTPDYKPLAKIGINVQLGLEYCCGEDDFYIEMLLMFRSQSVDKKAEIINLYETANWADYTVKVHALKSTSLTIGAERLAEQARVLEQAGKQGNIEYIRHCHHELLRLYDEVCETIDQL